MSKGPGRIERAIRELFDTHPDLAFVTDELCEHCYPDTRPIERKHQVSVLRAAWNVLKDDPDWSVWRIMGMGRGWVFFNHASAQSYTLGRKIVDNFIVYRSEKRARRQPGEWVWIRGSGGGRRKIVNDHRGIVPDRAALLASYSGCPHERWARHIAWHIEWRDGDAATRAAVDASREADHQAWLTEGVLLADRVMGRGPPDDKRYQAHDIAGSETLIALAGRLRGLLVQNDPDTLRAGLADIADALDAVARDPAAAHAPHGQG
jgi:hypothetical protein